MASHSRRSACITTSVIALLGMTQPVAAEESRGERRYIVVLYDSVSRPSAVAAGHERDHGADVGHVYEHVFKGYAAELPEAAVSEIARDPRVASIEADAPFSTTAQTSPTGVRRIFTESNTKIAIDGSDEPRVDVDIAIIDTGIQTDHPDLNVVSSTNCIATGSFGACVDGAGGDDHNHGTHVAGTAAAIDNGTGVVGVAPGARLHAVKVLTAVGSGFTSDVIAGIDYVTSRADTIEVANMSLGCVCSSTALDRAISASVDRGIVYVVAAGNDGIDVARFSPANHPDVIAVSALADFDGAAGGGGTRTCRADEDDTLANFSNWGGGIDVAAPGVCILSTSRLGGYQALSGTSMASPHVAGAAAILTSGANDPQDRGDVAIVGDMIRGAGNLNWFDDSGDGVLEPLADVSDAAVFAPNSPVRTLGETSGSTPPPTEDRPTAEFSYSCSEFSCVMDGSASSDPNGEITTYRWDFGDGTTGSGPTPTKTYGASGGYTVILTVTNDGGATATSSQTVSVAENDGDFELNIWGSRAMGNATIQLDWSGTDRQGAMIVYRDGVVVATTEDDGSYTDTLSNSSGTIRYRVCEQDTTRCSNEAVF